MSKSNKYLTHHSLFPCYCCCSVAQLCLTLQIHELQHTRVPCPSPSPGVCSNLCPLSWWCWQITHLILSSPDSFNHSSSVAPFSSCPQSFPALGSFPMSRLFSSGGQSIRASASVLPMNIQGWSPSGLIGLTFMLSNGLSRIFFSTTVWKHQFFMVQLSHTYMTTGKTIALTI